MLTYDGYEFVIKTKFQYNLTTISARTHTIVKAPCPLLASMLNVRCPTLQQCVFGKPLSTSVAKAAFPLSLERSSISLEIPEIVEYRSLQRQGRYA